MTVVVGLLLFGGVLLMFVAALGLLKMPDVLLRLSTTTKAVTLGAGCVLSAAALHFGDVGVAARVLATIVFLAATAPVAAHMTARAAYVSRTSLWHGTKFDELRQAYDEKQGTVSSPPTKDALETRTKEDT